MAKQGFKMENVERLTRGKRSGSNIGSRAVGYHLRTFERTIYERALKDRFLVIDQRSRENLWSIWLKVALAKDWKPLILIKNTPIAQGDVFLGEDLVFSSDLTEAKRTIRELAKQYNTVHKLVR